MAFSGSGAGQGAAQGAQMGMSFGPWGALIGAGVGAIAGGLEGGKAEKAAKKLLDYQNNIIQKKRDLQKERNKLLMQETARATADIMKERSYSIRNTGEALNYIERSSGMQKADISVQNATADAIGASAQIQYSAADAQADIATAQQWLEQEVTMDNLSSSLSSLLRQARGMVDVTEYASLVSTKNQSAETASALLGLAGAAGSAYSQGMFQNLGRGTSGGTYGSTNVRVNGQQGFRAGRGPGR